MSTTILPDSLVSTAWLADHLHDPRVRVVDIRGYVKTTDLGEGRQHADYLAAVDEYDAAHIPGAMYVDWTADIVDRNHPVKAQIAPPDAFSAAMEAIGVGDETDVVVVAHTGGHFATRLWWALKYHGHDRVAVLDGGFAKWVTEGRETDGIVPAVSVVRFTPRLRLELRVEAGDVLELSRRGAGHIVDARDEGQYTGQTIRGSRGGHIPSAVHIPAKSLMNADGTWKSREDQRDILVRGGVRPGERTVAYCNGGVTATAVLFALDRIGHTDFANYDGSWNEWGEREDFPTEA